MHARSSTRRADEARALLSLGTFVLAQEKGSRIL